MTTDSERTIIDRLRAWLENERENTDSRLVLESMDRLDQLIAESAPAADVCPSCGFSPWCEATEPCENATWKHDARVAEAKAHAEWMADFYAESYLLDPADIDAYVKDRESYVAAQDGQAGEQGT